MFPEARVSTVCGGVLLALAIFCITTSTGSAQQADREAGRRHAPAGDGRTQPEPAPESERAPSADNPGSSRAEPESRVVPETQPYGGCPYRERPLELIV